MARPPDENQTAPGLEREAVDAMFRSDTALKHALTENLKSLRAESEAVVSRVDSAFAEFSLKPVPPEESASSNYVEPGTDIGEALDRVILDGVDALKSSDTTRAMTFGDRAVIESVTTELPDGSSSVDLGKLIELIDQKSSGSSLVETPTYVQCKAELRADEILAAIEPGHEAEAASARDGTPTMTRGADKFVKEFVNRQMNAVTSPEERLEYGSMPKIPNTADENETQIRILDTFQLRPGASDVTSYHDFHTLQIAFPHVWTRIFDGELEGLGRELYREYVKLKDFGGFNTADLRINTVNDLRRLIDEVRKLSQWVEDDLPSDLRGAGEDQGGSKGVNDLDTSIKAGLGVATGGLTWILEWALKEFAKMGRKPIITWEQFPGPWPPRPDKIVRNRVDGVAPPGNVEIALRTDANSKIKIVELELFDQGTQRYVPGRRIDNRGHNTYVSMVVPTAWMTTSVLEFASEETSQWDTPGRYVLAELGRVIVDGSRVTFDWKDS